MKFDEKMRNEAQGIVKIIEYLNEKLLGFELRIFMDTAKINKKVVNMYFGPVTHKYCSGVLFPGCNVIGRKYMLSIATKIGTRFPTEMGEEIHGKVRVRLGLKTSKFLWALKGQIEAEQLADRLSVALDKPDTRWSYW